MADKSSASRQLLCVQRRISCSLCCALMRHRDVIRAAGTSCIAS